MLSIYKHKKLFWDVGFLVYTIIVILLGFFFSIDSFFAFSNGADLGGGSTTNKRGISIMDLIQDSSYSEKDTFMTLMILIIIILILLLITKIFYAKFISNVKFKSIESLQGLDLVLWFVLLVFYSMLFSAAREPKDYATIRVYGTGLFGILGLLSIVVIVIVESVIIGRAFLEISKREKSSGEIAGTTIQLGNNTKLMYKIGFAIMAIQNILVGAVFFIMQFVLLIDLIGIGLILVITIIYGNKIKNYKLIGGGILLAIWIIIAFSWRISIGVYKGLEGAFTTSSGSDVFGNAIISFIIASFFLSGGLYLVLSTLFNSFDRLKLIILLYCIGNVLSVLLLFSGALVLVQLGLYGKLSIIPFLGLVMYVYILGIMFRRLDSTTKTQNMEPSKISFSEIIQKN